MRVSFIHCLFVLTLIGATPVRAGEPFLKIQDVTTPGGVKAWLVEDHSAPVVAVEFAFIDAGSARDPAGRQGMAQLLSNTLDEGAGDLDSQSFQKKLADHSISLSYRAGRDDFYGSLKMLKRETATGFDLLRLSLTAPRFEDDALRRMKDSNMARIRSSLSDPDWIAARFLNDRIYEGHPYALNSGGTLSSLPAITSDDLRTFMKANITRESVRVAVTGAITARELAPYLDSVFGAIPAGTPRDAIPEWTIRNTGAIAVFEKDIPQTIIQMAQPGISRRDTDWPAAQVMNFILGSSGFGSRLMEEVREKRGLTYGIYTGFNPLEHMPTLTLSTSTRNEKAAEVLDLIRAEWVRMRDTDVTATELADAKAYLVGSMPLALTSTDTIAGMVLGLMLDDLPRDYLDGVAEKYNALTVEDIRRAAQRLLTPDALAIILVGKPQGLKDTVQLSTIPNAE